MPDTVALVAQSRLTIKIGEGMKSLRCLGQVPPAKTLANLSMRSLYFLYIGFLRMPCRSCRAQVTRKLSTPETSKPSIHLYSWNIMELSTECTEYQPGTFHRAGPLALSPFSDCSQSNTYLKCRSSTSLVFS